MPAAAASSPSLALNFKPYFSSFVPSVACSVSCPESSSSGGVWSTLTGTLATEDLCPSGSSAISLRYQMPEGMEAGSYLTMGAPAFVDAQLRGQGADPTPVQPYWVFQPEGVGLPGSSGVAVIA